MNKEIFCQKSLRTIISLLLLLFTLSSASALVTVSPSPYNKSICPEDSFLVNITLSSVANVYGFQYELGYNSSVLEAVSVLNGTLLSNNGQYNTFCLSPDLSTPGMIRNIVCTRIGNYSSSPSSGLLSVIVFRLKNGITYPATGNFAFYNVKLVDVNGTTLNNQTQNTRVNVSSCACTEGETRDCTNSNGCSGSRTCTGGVLGDCISLTPYFCDTDCDGNDECSEHECADCECIGSEHRSCETGEECDGREYCVGGVWSDCQILGYYCDINCDGTNDTCSDDPCPDPCICPEDWDCDAWSTCLGGSQSRTCYDLNDCGTEDDKPSLTRSCTISTGGSGGGGGGGGGGSLPPPCTEEWFCDNWGSCQPDGFRRRTCNDASNCGTSKEKPQELETCFYEGTCYDGIMNGPETDVDCGGNCPACPEPEPIGPLPPQLNLVVKPVEADILDQYALKVTVENQGQEEVKDLNIVASKWSIDSEIIQSLMPGLSEQKELLLNLPENPDEVSLDVQVVQNGVILLIQTIPVVLSVPEFSVKVNKDLESGRIYETVIVDNRNKPARTLSVDLTINKGKETYLLDTDRVYAIGENQVFNQVDYLYQDLPAGKYDVNSVFFENGEKISEVTSFVTLGGGEQAINVKYLFYLMLLAIVGISGYVFFMSQKK
jgi:hypothetical protein